MIVYKYRPVDKYTLELLINNEFHLSFPEDFNDPFDCYMQVKFEGTIEDFIKTSEKRDKSFDRNMFLNTINPSNKKFEDIKDVKQFYEHDPYYFRNQKKMLVCCFAAKNDNILMWSHYSNCHKGIVLGFQTYVFNNAQMLTFDEDVNPIITSFPKNNYPLFKVKYDKIPFVYNMLDYEDIRLVEFATTKSPDWNYEQEYRLLYIAEHWKKSKMKFSKKILKEVLFGLETSDEDKKTIRSIIKDKGYDVHFFQCERKKDEYGLDIVPA